MHGFTNVKESLFFKPVVTQVVCFKGLNLFLLYCFNSCTSLHFKTLKSHTKSLKIRPYMFRSPLKTIFRGSMAVLRYVTELVCWFTFVIKSVGLWLYVSSFRLCVCVCVCVCVWGGVETTSVCVFTLLKVFAYGPRHFTDFHWYSNLKLSSHAYRTPKFCARILPFQSNRS
jgi:hypothetical protein